MKSSRMVLVVLAAAALGSFGCEGKFGVNGADGIEQFKPPVTETPEGDPPPGTIMRPGDDPVAEEACQFISPGATPMRRLTGEEYHNTVRALFDFATIPNQTFSADERVSNFEANTVSSVTALQAEEYHRAAEAISEVVVAALGRTTAPTDDETREFIDEYGVRAYRRPLTAEESDGLFALYTIGATEIDATTGTQMVVEALLQSPNFLYRPEFGEDSTEDVVRLTNDEIASRLSYFLWGSSPDEALLNAAAAGELTTNEQIEAQARRMIGDPRARLRLNDAMAQWLRIDELDRVDNPDPAFTDEVRSSMVDETRAFIDHVVWDPSSDGSVSSLLTADYTFVDANTAALYGIAAPAGEGMVRVDLPAGRKGLLSHPGVLTAHGHGAAPVYRGKFVRESFLCLNATAPLPPNEIEPLPSFEGESQRSKSEKRLAARDEGCAGCHAMMDSVGLAFDNFDSLGRYQTQDEFGNELHGQAEILYTVSTDGEVNGATELADALGASDDVSGCVSAQFFRYAFARVNGSDDACSLYMVNEAFAQSGNDIKEMFVALVTTDAFLYRRKVAPGM